MITLNTSEFVHRNIHVDADFDHDEPDASGSAHSVGHSQSRHAETDTPCTATQRAVELIDKTRSVLFAVDRDILEHDGDVPPQTYERLRDATLGAVFEMHKIIGPDSGLEPEEKCRVGSLVQEAFLPYLLLTGTIERFYEKPRGYAGDYRSIRMIYERGGKGHGRIGPLLDRALLESPATIACCNRRPLLLEELRRTADSTGGRPAHVTSLGSGPAEELFDYFAQPNVSKEHVRATCVDLDLEALSFVNDRARKLGLLRQITPVNANLLRVLRRPHLLPLQNQDLIYSVGLIDYFRDDHVVSLLDRIYDWLRPGGRVLLGNFHPSNCCREFMDYVLEWKLIHRDEEQMHKLFQRSRFGRRCTEIRFEPQGINLFAICERADH